MWPPRSLTGFRSRHPEGAIFSRGSPVEKPVFSRHSAGAFNVRAGAEGDSSRVGLAAG